MPRPLPRPSPPPLSSRRADGRTAGRPRGRRRRRRSAARRPAGGRCRGAAGRGRGGAGRARGGAEEGPVGIPFPEHSADVLGGLNAQRQSGQLCDVLLVAGEREFPAHRSVLASCSSYFHRLFTSGVAADRQSVYALDFVRAEALDALLDFAYTATLTVSHASVRDVLSAASLLEIPPVRDVCAHLLDTKVLSPPQLGGELGEEDEAEGRERGKEAEGERASRLQAQEYLQLFQQGAQRGGSPNSGSPSLSSTIASPTGQATPPPNTPPTPLHRTCGTRRRKRRRRTRRMRRTGRKRAC
ncbi:hypothetical protein ANANG_G00131060 [Anguilla anguilla]|uniref:BTB domain-containing protein n=1 Tax=Anguilla anguilla TaxID=7936 RepID=A0A9D3MF84_ANGAN|nr:hypothetical protein ANANG_G00131060 [Anguilla anguilla]